MKCWSCGKDTMKLREDGLCYQCECGATENITFKKKGKGLDIVEGISGEEAVKEAERQNIDPVYEAAKADLEH